MMASRATSAFACPGAELLLGESLRHAFSEVTADNLVLVNEKGEIIDGGPMINSAGFYIHAAIHHARPDVNCAAHTHPPAGSAFSALGSLIEPLDQTCCSFYDDHAVYDSYTGIVLDEKQAQEIVDALGSKRALILKNHGLLTAAGTVEQALLDMLDMERSCWINLRAMATGRPLHTVPPEAARQARSVLSQPMRYPFQWGAVIRDLNRYETDYDPTMGK
ncbi:MAG: class II aldolase/adducin family protein [Planctomycetota bacterium]